jgi:hypothetical protein
VSINFQYPAGQKLSIVSVATRNYLYRAQALFESIAEHFPEAKRIVCCADYCDFPASTSERSFEIVAASELGIPRYRQIAFALNPTALCCFLKPYAVQFALQNDSISRVIYIDNDMALFRCPSDLLKALETSSCVFTPHHLHPLKIGAIPDEQVLHTFGIFNAGILGFRRCEETLSFLNWWADWMGNPRRFHFQSGYDQVWLNYAAVYCPNHAILRDPTYNVAFWNLSERDLWLEGKEFYCGSKKLTTFHFSNFSEAHPESLVWPPNVSNYTRNDATEKIAADIVSKWEKCGKNESLALGYGYAKWPDGSEVTLQERQALCFQWDELPMDVDPWRSDFPDRYPEIYQKIRIQAISHENSVNNRLKTIARWLLDLSLRKIVKVILRIARINS